MQNNYIDYLIEYMPSSFVKFYSYPGVIERIELFTINIPIFVFILASTAIAYRVISDSLKSAFLKSVFTLIAVCPFLIRYFYGYAYDTPFAIISQIADIALLLFLVFKVGSKISYRKNIVLNCSIGLSIFALLFTVAIILNINYLVSVPFTAIHLLFVGWFVFEIWSIDLNISNLAHLDLAIITLVMILPFLPMLFAPAPQDADIITMTDMIGFLFQGQSFGHIYTGIRGEWFSLRYPAGFPSLGWGLSHILNIRASEVVLLLSFISLPLIIGNLYLLARQLNINKYVVLLFVINSKINGILGLHGGQVQEMLAYGLGIGMINLLFVKRLNQAMLAVSAATVIHPMVALSFWGVIVVWSILNLIKRKISIPQLLPSIFISAFTFLYLAHLGTGDAIQLSWPVRVINTLTLNRFFSNIYAYLLSDTYNLPFFLFSFFLVFLFKNFEKEKFAFIIIWLFGAILNDGFFGYLGPETGRFLADFNIIAIWVLSVALSYSLIVQLIPKSLNIRWTVFPIFIFFWILYLAPGFRLKPESTFVTHSDIRMGRFMEDNLENDSLVANIRPSKDPSSQLLPNGLGFMMRGNSSKNTIFHRLGSNHQIKNGIIKSRKPYNQCKILDPNKSYSCLAKLGVTHLVIGARPYSKEFVSLLNIKPIKQYGETYLFDIRAHR
jgi:hypothetical protein